MTTPVAVTENDLHAMLRIVRAPDRDADGDGLPWSTLYGLQELIPCDVVTYNGLAPRDRQMYRCQNTLGDQPQLPGEPTAFWTHYLDSPSSYPDRTGDLCSVTKDTDFCSIRQYRQTPIYTDFFRLRDQEYKMLLALPDDPGRTSRLVFFRGRGSMDYTERDRALLILLRPHLLAAHLDVRRRRRGTPKLTHRQWELLHLVDAGYSNTQIAWHLAISAHTVRKHLENIFERLQVSSRTAALARVFPERAPKI